MERPRKHWAAAESGTMDVPGPRASSCPSTPEASTCSAPRLPSPLPTPGLKAPTWLGGEGPRLGPEYFAASPAPRRALGKPTSPELCPTGSLRRERDLLEGVSVATRLILFFLHCRPRSTYSDPGGRLRTRGHGALGPCEATQAAAPRARPVRRGPSPQSPYH